MVPTQPIDDVFQAVQGAGVGCCTSILAPGVKTTQPVLMARIVFMYQLATLFLSPFLATKTAL